MRPPALRPQLKRDPLGAHEPPPNAKMEQPRYFTLDIQRELRRIGVDLARLTGLAANGGPSPTDFFRWLRTIPGGIGHEAFLARLQAPPTDGGPHAPDLDEPPAPDVATHADPDIDESKALLQELDRVVPRSTWPEGSTGFGFDWPHGRAHALAVLRTLPDQAGPDAFIRALEATPPLADPPSADGAGA